MNYSMIFFIALGITVITSCTQSDTKTETVVVDDDVYHVTWLRNESFRGDWEARWIAECDSCSLWVEDQKLYIDDYKGATIWNVTEYPANLIVRYKVKGLARDDNKTNFNLMTHATEPDGTPLMVGHQSERNGVYKTYHKLPNYLTTFVYKWSRLRRNPGFKLLSDVQSMASAIDTEYEVVFTANEERLRYYINGVKVHDEPNDNPLPGGKIGIRTWNTLAVWYDIAIGELIEESR